MESDKQYRAELQGSVGGLSRVYAITIEDGHSFCRIDQVKDEIINMCNIIRDFYTKIGLWEDHWVSLSVRDYEHPEKYDITEITPSTVYKEIFPTDADVSKLAWLFTANYKCESKDNRQLNSTIREKVQLWTELWKKGKTNIPVLRILKGDEKFFLEDSRDGYLMRENITKQQAKMALFGLLSNEIDELNWGIEKKVIFCYENKYIPLATANPRVFEELEND